MKKILLTVSFLVFGIIIGGAVSVYTLKNIKKINSNNIRYSKVAVLDGSLVKEKAKPFIDVNDLSKKAYLVLYKDVQKQENILRKLYQKIKNENNAKLKQEFDHKLEGLQDYIQKEQIKINEKFDKLRESTENAFYKVIQKIAKKYEIDIVLNVKTQDKRLVFFHKESFDITKEVIESLKKFDIKNIQ